MRSKKLEEQLLILKEKELALENERKQFELEKERWKIEMQKELENRFKTHFEKYTLIFTFVQSN
jgi:hypothetical protein